MIRPDVIKTWAVAVLVYFMSQAVEPVVTDDVVAATLSIIYTVIYIAVAIYTFAPAPRPKSPERPSAVRSRIEAKRSRQQS